MSADPPEYEELYGWERRACLKRFHFHFKLGFAVHPEKPEVVWDRAVYLGYRGGLQSWAYVVIAAVIPLLIVAVVLRHESWRAVPIAVCVLPPLWAFVMGITRIARSQRLHPNWRHYKIYVDETDWNVTIAQSG